MQLSVYMCSTAAEHQSPYLQKLGSSQKLGNSHVVPMNNSHLHPRRRPTSAASAGRPASAGVGGARGGDRPMIDAQFIGDTDLWDSATPHDRQPPRRPTSAPVYKRFADYVDVMRYVCVDLHSHNASAQFRLLHIART